ncbi:MAG: S8 family serine peptidase [Gemmataceae bacterium]
MKKTCAILVLIAWGSWWTWGGRCADPSNAAPMPDGIPEQVRQKDTTPDPHLLGCEMPAEENAALLRQQLLQRLGVDRWHEAGFRGQGVKIALLDSGFRGYRAHLGKTLPAKVRTQSFRFDGQLEGKDSQHGILCGEILHALAPEAELLLAAWEPNNPAQFLKAVRWAKEQGARVLSCSVIIPSWSDGAGGGHIHQELRGILGTGDEPADVLFFASAGNTAQRHWHGRFRDNGQGYHDWHDGIIDNKVYPWDNQRLSVELYWNSEARYQVVVQDDDSGERVAQASAVCPGQHYCAAARFQPQASRCYRVRVKLVSGPPGPFHLVVLGGHLTYRHSAGSIAFPADGEHVVAVGAVDAAGERMSYSSCGGAATPKPDFVGVVPFPSVWRPRPFSGTSAAAPQAAALAALWWSRHPHWTAAQTRAALQRHAIDLGPPGHDIETGHGLITLPTAGLSEQ